jgi:hypothetical protein
VVTAVLAFVLADRRDEFAAALGAVPIWILLAATAGQLLALVWRGTSAPAPPAAPSPAAACIEPRASDTSAASSTARWERRRASARCDAPLRTGAHACRR